MILYELRIILISKGPIINSHEKLALRNILLFYLALSSKVWVLQYTIGLDCRSLIVKMWFVRSNYFLSSYYIQGDMKSWQVLIAVFVKFHAQLQNVDLNALDWWLRIYFNGYRMIDSPTSQKKKKKSGIKSSPINIIFPLTIFFFKNGKSSSINFFFSVSFCFFLVIKWCITS